jgi:hypothetical protein
MVSLIIAVLLFYLVAVVCRPSKQCLHVVLLYDCATVTFLTNLSFAMQNLDPWTAWDEFECKGEGGKRWFLNNDEYFVQLAAQTQHNT